MYVEDVKDGKRTYTYIFVQGMCHVEDVGDVILILFECNAIYVEDVKDKEHTYRHIFIITFLIWYHLNVMLSMSKIDQDVEDGKRTYTYMFAHNFLNM